MTNNLSIYLNDHLAGATAGLELAKRTAGSNKNHASGEVLRQIADEIDSDRETLKDVMKRLDIGRDPVKPLVAWALEKAGRLKPNGHILGYSPLSRLEELEGLTAGVTGKRSLWRVLHQTIADDERLEGVDFATLIERADSQLERLGALREPAAAQALS